MSSLLTLVASDQTALSAGHLALTETALEDYKVFLDEEPRWLSEHKAAQFIISSPLRKSQIDKLRDKLCADKIDIFMTAKNSARKKLIIADMDSTIVTEETLDEIAKTAGYGKEVSDITTQSMNGKLDFAQALKERVKMLEGQDESLLKNHLPTIELSGGAKTLIQTMAAHGAVCVLVSGGFTYFTEYVAKQAGFHHHHGNILEITDAKLTGEVVQPILDKHAKYEYLKLYMEELGIDIAETITIGDGANDFEMLLGASLGIGFHPKQLLVDELDNLIMHTDLTSALYAQGYSAAEFVS